MPVESDVAASQSTFLLPIATGPNAWHCQCSLLNTVLVQIFFCANQQRDCWNCFARWLLWKQTGTNWSCFVGQAHSECFHLDISQTSQNIAHIGIWICGDFAWWVDSFVIVWLMLNSKEWPICSELLELFLRPVLWKWTENNCFLLVPTVLPVRHQLGKHQWWGWSPSHDANEIWDCVCQHRVFCC